MTTVTAMEAVGEKIQSLNYGDYTTEIKTEDSVHTQKEVKDGACMDVVCRTEKSQETKKAKFESVPPKVDEFGRLVREGSSDSDSDDSLYNKRYNKRGRSRIHSHSRSRSRSRSRSPLDSRRGSSWRRREKRSRSRSRSSRNQRSRSRSRSPTFRRANEFRDGSKRQDRRHIPECFDFLRGRCYRGAHCRYMHREYDKNDGSRQHRSKPTLFESQPSFKTFGIKEKVDEIKAREMQLCEDAPIARKDGQLIDAEKMNCESSRVTDIAVQVKQIVPENLRETTIHIPDRKEFHEVQKSHHPPPQLISSAGNMKSSDGTSEDVLPLMNKSVVEQPQKADCPSVQMENSFITDLSPVQVSTTSPNMVSSSEPLPNAIASTNVWPIKSSNDQPLSSQFMAPNSKELPLPSISAVNVPYLSELPLPPPPPQPSQGASAVHAPQMHRDYNLMPLCPPQSISYQGSLPNQHAQFSLPPNSPWTSLPPPPPRPLYDSSLNAGTTALGGSSQFQPNHLVPRNDFGSQPSIRPYSTVLPSHSQAGDFLHRMYPPMQEFPRPVLHRADFRSGNSSSQPFGGPGHMREDHFTHAPVQDLSSHTFAHGNTHPQPGPPSQELTMNKLQNFSGDNFPSGELLNSSSQIHPCSQNQQPTYSTQYPVGDGILGVPGKTGAQYPVGDSILGFPGKDGPMSQYPTDLVDRNQSSRLPDFGASRIPTHHNPYASTFEQPLSSKFSSNIHNQDNGAPSGNMFDTPGNLSQVLVDGQGVGSVGSRQTTSSPSSARAAGQLLPKSEAEQYDPLWDSIEPSSALLEKHGHGQKQESAGDSNIIVRLSENKHKEVETVASATSLDIDEFGETADAEVGVVEDESLSDRGGGAANMAGEIEIDQVESPGKSKKKKDSRSTRLFKIAIANFVKEILKPSWRQGNMSKEAFKTIVKKTVDKVSGAMKKHQIPKSEAKINHYIDSSQRKLTKLVMGYVDKYVNV